MALGSSVRFLQHLDFHTQALHVAKGAMPWGSRAGACPLLSVKCNLLSFPRDPDHCQGWKTPYYALKTQAAGPWSTT